MRREGGVNSGISLFGLDVTMLHRIGDAGHIYMHLVENVHTFAAGFTPEPARVGAG
jgi:hypothetical protein